MSFCKVAKSVSRIARQLLWSSVFVVCSSTLLACNDQKAEEPPKQQPSESKFSSPEDYSFDVPVDTVKQDSVAVDTIPQDSIPQDTVSQDSIPQDIVVPPPSDTATAPVKNVKSAKNEKPAAPAHKVAPKSSATKPASSSSMVLSSSEAAIDSLAKDSALVDTALCSNVELNQICDARDGKRYRYVAIGKQTWMSQNLAYKTESSWCVDKDENCALYGRLYTWNVANSCPEGWRLPSMEDFTKLKNFIEKKLKEKSGVGTALKAISGWEDDEDDQVPPGTNLYGFAAKPAGYRDARGNFVSVGSEANFWTSQEVPGEDRASYWNLYYANQDFIGSYVGLKTSAMSVRCIKN